MDAIHSPQRTFNINIPPDYLPPPPPAAVAAPPIPPRSSPPILQLQSAASPIAHHSPPAPPSSVSISNSIGTSIAGTVASGGTGILGILKSVSIIVGKGVLTGVGMTVGAIGIDETVKAIKGKEESESNQLNINETKELDKAWIDFEEKKTNVTNVIAEDFKEIEKEWHNLNQKSIELNEKEVVLNIAREKLFNAEVEREKSWTNIFKNSTIQYVTDLKKDKKEKREEGKKYKENILNNSSQYVTALVFGKKDKIQDKSNIIPTSTIATVEAKAKMYQNGKEMKKYEENENIHIFKNSTISTEIKSKIKQEKILNDKLFQNCAESNNNNVVIYIYIYIMIELVRII
jgi:hypothetical protein